MSRMQRGVILIVGLAAAGIAVAVPWTFSLRQTGDETSGKPSRTTEEAPRRRSVRSNQYVGSQACAECHAEYFDRYQSHPMSRSMARAAEATPVDADGGEPPVHPPGPRRYGVELRGNDVVHFEEFVNREGEVVYRQEVPVHYAVGSGRRGRSYMTDREGVMFQSPLTWYAQADRWDLSPGYAPEHHPRFERRIADGCVACHAGTVRPEPAGPHRFANEPFAELSIGCERCHGPGEAHVAWHSGEGDRTQEDAIVNPAKLDPARRDSVCYQCHLHGLERIVRSGCTEYSFRPGDLLSDVWVVFTAGAGARTDGTTAAVSQVEQMHASQCYQESAGAMGCTSCHDPHRVPPPSEQAEFYRERCQACHVPGVNHCALPLEQRQAASSGDSCIGCHMPSLAASDVPHTSQTDHRILRRPETGASPSGPAGNTPGLFAPELFPVPMREFARAEGLALAGMAERSGGATFARQALSRLLPIAEELADDATLLDATATCLLIGGDLSGARHFAERALAAQPGREATLETLIMTCQQQGDATAGLDYADAFLKINRWQSNVHAARARFLWRLGRLREAVEALRQALALNPLLHDARRMLVDLLGRLDDQSGRAEQERLLQTLQPGDGER